MSRYENVTSEVIGKVRATIDRKDEDILELTPDEKNEFLIGEIEYEKSIMKNY